MAIPNWTWPESSHGSNEPPQPRESLDPSEIENATSVFEILSNTTRLEILAILSEESNPISYTKLRESTSVDDKGKFNYHLRKMEHLLWNQDGDYTLTERGEALIQRILSDNLVLDYEHGQVQR